LTMTEVTIYQIKKLREQTDMPVMDCRQALEEAGGDEKKALDFLKAKGLARAEKKANRQVKAGLISAYTHTNGQIGVLVELACETDFVSRNEEFQLLAHELCLQVASMNPKNVEELLKQPWIRDDKKTIDDLVKETIGKLGENIVIRRIVRFALGENVADSK